MRDFVKNTLLNRLFTSGDYEGGTDCTQSVKYSQITQYNQNKAILPYPLQRKWTSDEFCHFKPIETCGKLWRNMRYQYANQVRDVKIVIELPKQGYLL